MAWRVFKKATAKAKERALYWAGISSDEWYDMAEVKGIWNKVTHGEWNGTAGI